MIIRRSAVISKSAKAICRFILLHKDGITSDGIVYEPYSKKTYHHVCFRPAERTVEMLVRNKLVRVDGELIFPNEETEKIARGEKRTYMHEYEAKVPEVKND